MSYTPMQIRFLAYGYRLLRLQDLTLAFNIRFDTSRSESAIRSALCNRDLRSGRTGHFGKGAQSWNHGTKGMTRPNRTSFQPGHQRTRTKQLYAERVNRDGYIEIKIPETNPYTGCPTRFKLKHQFVWESTHGPIPAGHVVSFRDGNRLNCAPDNLLLLNRQELLYLNQNGYSELHGELRQALIACARLFARAKAGERRVSNA